MGEDGGYLGLGKNRCGAGGSAGGSTEELTWDKAEAHTHFQPNAAWGSKDGETQQPTKPETCKQPGNDG
jgi:hypothetical protein